MQGYISCVHFRFSSDAQQQEVLKNNNNKTVVSNIGSRNMKVWGCEVMALGMQGLVVTVPLTLVHALVHENECNA